MTAVFAVVLGASVPLLLIAIAVSRDGLAPGWKTTVAAAVGFGMAGLSATFAGLEAPAAILGALIGAGGMALVVRWVG
ncbi:MAG: hypothetical protein HKN07_11560 [Acidimicrobiia bacterium]|nr:hypothetical protein [Acidimicrobiia bacterium]NNF64877.1 hypothetical protein [Acidimicrobiia bacterium]